MICLMLSQVRRRVRQRLPEIIDPVRLAGGHDIVIYGAHFGAGIGIFDHVAIIRERGVRARAA